MPKNFLKTNIVLLTILIFSLIPIFVISAATSSATGLNIPNPLGGTSDISALVSNIIKFLIILAIPITAILVVYAGFLYITSAGNEEKIKIAQKALIWAIVGFAVVLIASSVPAIIQEFLSGEEESSGIGAGGGAGTGIGAEGEGEINFETEEESEGEEATEEEEAVEEETGTYKDCEFDLIAGTSACVTMTWSGIENKPEGNFCENDSFCQKFLYKVCRKNIETGEPFCKASVWYGTDPKPNNECEDDSDCQSASASGTYKACRDSNWSWLSGNQTLYCKTAIWTGENPGDECSVLDEVCPVGSGGF